MTILLGDTGRARYGPLKKFSISYAKHETDLSATPITLPTTKSTTAQFSYTVQANDLTGLITPTPVSSFHTALLYVAGHTGAAATSINAQVNLNGTNMYSGSTSSIGAGLKWTSSMTANINDLAVSDIIDVFVWSSQTDVIMDYKAIIVFPVRYALSRPNTIITNCKMSGLSQVNLTLGGSPALSSSYDYNLVLQDGKTRISGSGTADITVPINMPATPINQNSNTTLSGGLGTVYFGDAGYRGYIFFDSHATNHPYYRCQYSPSSITFRELSL